MGSLLQPNDKDHCSSRPIGLCSGRAGWGAVLLGFAIFGLLWILHISISRDLCAERCRYSRPRRRLTSCPWRPLARLVHSRLLAFLGPIPGLAAAARLRGFTRPAFQFVIYLAHFVLGRDWALYQLINCFAVAGMAAVAFLIAQTALGLRTGLSLVAAMLVVLSPPVLDSWLFGLAFAHRTARHSPRSRRLPCGSRSPRLSLSRVALSGAADQRERCVGACCSCHNHYAAAQTGRVAPSSGVYRCGHVLTGGDVAGPPIRLLRRHWRHLCNGRIHATCETS